MVELAITKNHKNCIEWPLGKDNKGYGAIFYQGKRYKAHRLAKILKDEIENPPPEVFACHKCDNRTCINPSHIYWGTAKTNKSDQTIYYKLQK